jgi:ATP-dependent Clp protease ATP-binding subunit ClpA
VPKINVYLPDELADAVKETGLPVSAVCQHALEMAVRRVTDIRSAAVLDIALSDPEARLAAWFTARARHAVSLAAEQASDAGAAGIDTGHLLGGLLAEGGNMAVLVLRSLEIEPAGATAQPAGYDTAEAPDGRAAGPAASALELAAIEALALGHSYVGCEHILLGLITEPDGAAGRVLRSLGADQRAARRAVTAALGGFAQGRQPKRPQTQGPQTQGPQTQGQPTAAASPRPGAAPRGADHALQSVMRRLEQIERRLDALPAPPSPA